MCSELNAKRFNKLAQEWDSKPARIEGAMTFVDKILEDIDTDIKSFNILDYGSGSGLVSFGFANKAYKITGLDNSEEMVKVYNNKAFTIGLDNILSRKHDINKEELEENIYDLVVTNMTMHHINDIDIFIKKLSSSLKNDGYIYIADLISEDGTFHSDNTGVEHFGFDMEVVKNTFLNSGLKDVSIEILHTIDKPHKSFDIFIVRGRK
ncbi:MAG: class I SAM-dependent methyltransferase [Campylobacterota bacterium]|nr:class I SAM-dependent methyltransferase [Campylobacterota bacterium]